MTNSIGYGSEVPAPPIRRPKMNAEEKRKFYEKEIQKAGVKIEDIPQEFRTVEVYILALSLSLYTHLTLPTICSV